MNWLDSGRQCLVATCLMLVGATPVFANVGGELQPTVDIVGAIEQFVSAQRASDAYRPEIEVAKLDERLRLRKCDTPLQVQFTNPNRRIGSTYLTVKCVGTVAWRVHVATRVTAYGDVLVTTRPLPRGHLPQAADFRKVRRALSALGQGYFTDPAELRDVELRRAIGADVALSPGHVIPRRLIRNGDNVRLVAQTGRLQVRASGRALQDGRAGARIKVRNHNSGQIVEGTVSAAGMVIVN